MPKGQEECFFEGFLYAAVLIARRHQAPAMAAEIIKEVGIETWDCSDLGELEKETLRLVNNENGMRLRGLSNRSETDKAA